MYQRTIQCCLNDQKHRTSILVDVYSVLDAFGVQCPAVQHAIKKLLCAGQRGVKSREQDLREALIAIERAIVMETDPLRSQPPEKKSDANT